MFGPDPSLTYIAATREQVVSVIQSINHPHVGVPGYPTQPGEGSLVGIRNPSGSFSLFVHLYLEESKAAVVYVHEEAEVDVDAYPLVEGEGVEFLESMGFMVDNLNFRNLSPLQQEELMEDLPCFNPDPGSVATGEADSLNDSDVVELEELEDDDGALLEDGGRAGAYRLEPLQAIEEIEHLEPLGGTEARAVRAISPETAVRVARLLASF